VHVRVTYILRATNFYSGHKNPTTASKKPKRSRKTKKKRVKRSLDHIDRFFAGYPEFNYNSSNPIWTEFNRMSDFFDWDRDDEDDAKRDFKAAMKLCHVLNIEPAPTSLEACRERVRRTHVNLVDLVETANTGLPVKVFENLEQLQDYTVDNERFFPKYSAYHGGLLRFLLRQIL
ncbi:hypothetical protein FCULG_00011109, partial [Fusarium culmorum]